MMLNWLYWPPTASLSSVSDLMAAILHILTIPADSVTQEIISRQSQNPEAKVEVVDLTQPQPDYTALLAKIFDADSVAVW